MRAITNLGRLIRDILRELADERAYERHLLWENKTHSREEWIRFSEQKMKARFGNPKCC